MKKLISMLLIVAIVCSLGTSVFATNDYQQGTQVSYTGTGTESYTVTVPAKLAPGAEGDVIASGTWASNRKLVVTADATVELANSLNANDTKVLDVTFAGIALAGSNKVAVSDTKAVGVEAMPADALFGTWSGTFYYRVEMTDVNGTTHNRSEISVSATDKDGNDLEAKSFVIEGQEKSDLINSLKQTDLVDENTEIDALIEVKSNEFEDLANTTFDVSSIAKEGDTVVILHFNETKQEWEFISEETVDANGNVNADFSAYSPVAFVVIPQGGIVPPVNGNLYYAQPYNYQNFTFVFFEDMSVRLYESSILTDEGTYTIDNKTITIKDDEGNDMVFTISDDYTSIDNGYATFTVNTNKHDVYKNELYSCNGIVSMIKNDDDSIDFFVNDIMAQNIPAEYISENEYTFSFDGEVAYLSMDGTQLILSDVILTKENKVGYLNVRYNIEQEGDIFMMFRESGICGWQDQEDESWRLGPLNTYQIGRVVFLIGDDGAHTRYAMGRFSEDGKTFYAYNFLNEANPTEVIYSFYYNG